MGVRFRLESAHERWSGARLGLPGLLRLVVPPSDADDDVRQVPREAIADGGPVLIFDPCAGVRDRRVPQAIRSVSSWVLGLDDRVGEAYRWDADALLSPIRMRHT